jgi:hypothetical protein
MFCQSSQACLVNLRCISTPVHPEIDALIDVDQGLRYTCAEFNAEIDVIVGSFR